MNAALILGSIAVVAMIGWGASLAWALRLRRRLDEEHCTSELLADRLAQIGMSLSRNSQPSSREAIRARFRAGR